MNGHTLLTFFLSLRTIMLIGSAGALVGSLLMFLQGGFFLHEAWHTIMTEGDAVQKQVTVPVLEAVDSFLFGIVLSSSPTASPSASFSLCRRDMASGCPCG